jgi:hypothetical protein
MLKIYYLNSTYSESVSNDVYDKREIEVFNITGEVFIRALAK